MLDPTRTDATYWTERDKKLAVAWQTLQDETCKKCGTPTWLGHTEDERVDFKEEVTICYGCQVLEKSNAQDKKGVVEGGTKYVIPVPVDGEQLPTREEGYKRAQ